MATIFINDLFLILYVNFMRPEKNFIGFIYESFINVFFFFGVMLKGMQCTKK